MKYWPFRWKPQFLQTKEIIKYRDYSDEEIATLKLISYLKSTETVAIKKIKPEYNTIECNHWKIKKWPFTVVISGYKGFGDKKYWINVLFFKVKVPNHLFDELKKQLETKYRDRVSKKVATGNSIISRLL